MTDMTEAPPPRRTLVWFTYKNAEGVMGAARSTLDGVPDIRTLSEVLAAEKLLGDHFPQVSEIFITNWKALEG